MVYRLPSKLRSPLLLQHKLVSTMIVIRHHLHHVISTRVLCQTNTGDGNIEMTGTIIRPFCDVISMCAFPTHTSQPYYRALQYMHRAALQLDDLSELVITNISFNYFQWTWRSSCTSHFVFLHIVKQLLYITFRWHPIGLGFYSASA